MILRIGVPFFIDRFVMHPKAIGIGERDREACFSFQKIL